MEKSQKTFFRKLPIKSVSQGIDVPWYKRYLCHYSLSKYVLKPKHQGCVGIYEIGFMSGMYAYTNKAI